MSRRLANLASRFVGTGGVHVVDPTPDWRPILDDLARLEQNIAARGLPRRELEQLRSRYLEWYDAFERTKKGEKEGKAEARSRVDALLDVMDLPNTLGQVGDEMETEQRMPAGEAALKSLGLLRKFKGTLSMSGRPVIALRKIRQDLQSSFSNAHLSSPPFFARPALLEAMNWNLEDYLSFSDGSTKTFLLGHTLPTLLSSFIRARFSEGQEWPIQMHSAGPSYHNSPIQLVDGRQREKHCIVALCRCSDEASEWSHSTRNILHSYYKDTLDLNSVSSRLLSAPELTIAESSAHVVTSSGVSLSRVSMYDDFLSRRLNLAHSTGKLVHVAFAETDLSRLLSLLFDPATPKRVTDVL